MNNFGCKVCLLWKRSVCWCIRMLPDHLSFQQRLFWIRTFAAQTKGKDFVQPTSPAGSIGNYSSGLGHCQWQPFFSVPYLIRSCDCSLHIWDQKMSLINPEEQDSDSNIPWFKLGKGKGGTEQQNKILFNDWQHWHSGFFLNNLIWFTRIQCKYNAFLEETSCHL